LNVVVPGATKARAIGDAGGAAQAGEGIMNDWVNLLVSWLPFLLLIGVWFYFSRHHGMQAKGSSTGVTLIDLYEQQVAEARRMNANLERIAGALEKKS
jgi:ATP-dependent Zn protease